LSIVLIANLNTAFKLGRYKFNIMNSNIITIFLKETFERFFLKQPKFFKIITTVGVVITVFLGLPSFIATNQELICNEYNLCFEMPQWLDAFWAKATPIATLLGSFISSLTANSVDKAKLKNNLD